MEQLMLVVGSILVVGGGLMVWWRELRSQRERRARSRVEDAVLVLVPAVLAIVLVIAVWITA